MQSHYLIYKGKDEICATLGFHPRSVLRAQGREPCASINLPMLQFGKRKASIIKIQIIIKMYFNNTSRKLVVVKFV